MLETIPCVILQLTAPVNLSPTGRTSKQTYVLSISTRCKHAPYIRRHLGVTVQSLPTQLAGQADTQGTPLGCKKWPLLSAREAGVNAMELVVLTYKYAVQAQPNQPRNLSVWGL